MAQAFIFKQFTLQQQKAAFKLGTDSVLLGSWIPDLSYRNILDIGAGTGILSLMMAQRFNGAEILAIEIDQLSVEDCANNFNKAKWNDRLKIVEDDILNWTKKNVSSTFDLILTNPPYFINSLKNPDSRKSTARHSDTIHAGMLLEFVKNHLNKDGYFGIILPTKEFTVLANTFINNGFYLNTICRISSFKNGEIIREMGLFSFNKHTIIEEGQYLYKAENIKSDWYKNISNEFYIK